MARKKKKSPIESKGFTIVCRKCGFSGEVGEFSISATVCDCGNCSGGAEITIECRSCHSDMEVDSW